MDKITFCGQNYILWTKLHFVDKITFCGQKLHFVDKITFCRQNYILSRQNYILSRQNYILWTKITFCRQNYILSRQNYILSDKITFCQTKLHFVRQNYILLWLLQFCRRNCILSTEWICSSQFSILSRWRHLLNINYLYISLLSPITFEASHLCNHCIQVGIYSLF